MIQTLVGACFLLIPCSFVGYPGVLSPSEVVRLDALLSVFLEASGCNRILNLQSTFHSNDPIFV